MFEPIIRQNAPLAAFSPEIEAPQPRIQYFVINNADFVSSGSCRDLHVTHIDSPADIDRKLNQLVRMLLNGDEKVFEMHEKAASLDFDNIVVQTHDDIQVIPAQSVTIIALSDEEYELMVDTFIDKHGQEAVENDAPETQLTSRNQGFTSIALIRAITLVFRKEQEIVSFFKQAREDELARVDEDTRERQVKERDKRWNQWMDYWLQKDENRREILVSVIKVAA